MSRTFVNTPIFSGKSKYAEYLGFTADKFNGYLWDDGKGSILISLIFSKHPGDGNVVCLINHLLDLGFTVKIPTPSNRMRKIGKFLGFIETTELDNRLQSEVEILAKRRG